MKTKFTLLCLILIIALTPLGNPAYASGDYASRGHKAWLRATTNPTAPDPQIARQKTMARSHQIALAGKSIRKPAYLGNIVPVGTGTPLVACSNLTFTAPTNYALEDAPASVVVEDITGDGELDLITANGVHSSVSVLLGNETGSFSAATDFTTADASADGLVVVDVNGDSKKDLVVTGAFSEGGGGLLILLGDGNGSFGRPSVYPAGTYPYDVVIGDFNSDGQQDLAFTSAWAGTYSYSAVGIYLADGAGGFSYPPTFFPLVTDAYPDNVALGDFNGDSKLDLVTGNGNSAASISILLGDGMGSFGAPTYLSTGYAANITVGDFNGDDKQDLAATDSSSSSNTVSVLLGNGIGGFGVPTHFAVGMFPESVAVGDFNGDGKQDMAVVNRGSHNVSILLGNGMGAFGTAMNLTTGGTTPLALAVADFNGDNKQDLAIVNWGSHNVSILLNTCQAVPAQTFGDVPMDHWAWNFIEALYAAGITGGCSTNPLRYCPEGLVTRAQMAVLLERGVNGGSYTPPPVGASTGFGDVSTTYWAAAFIKQLAADGITAGCGNGNYCPESPVTRAQMAIFLLRARHGASYTPPPVGTSSGFGDVPTNYWAAAFIKQLAADGITAGCGNGNYCPESPVTRAQMAVFLMRALSLNLE